jgi:lysozyme
MSDIQTAIRIALKLAKASEGCNLRAYPDPASPLSLALSHHNLLNLYKSGHADIHEGWGHLSGEPWTIGYGETKGIKQDMVWNQEQAESAILSRMEGFVAGVLKASPNLTTASSEALAACADMAYNVGLANYSKSTVCKCIAAGDKQGAADAFLLWNKAGGTVMQGLVVRCNARRNLFLSVG